MRVLLIEDDSATAQSIELMLQSEGFNLKGIERLLEGSAASDVGAELRSFRRHVAGRSFGTLSSGEQQRVLLGETRQRRTHIGCVDLDAGCAGRVFAQRRRELHDCAHAAPASSDTRSSSKPLRSSRSRQQRMLPRGTSMITYMYPGTASSRSRDDGSADVVGCEW